jgi:hypothetical protein
MKIIITILIIQLFYFSLLYSQSEAAFKSVKVGMRDSQVEKILGYPVEIFRGFKEYDGSKCVVKTVGQLNYVCWRYNSKKTEKVSYYLDSIQKEIKVGIRYDTTYFIDGTECDKRWYNFYTDSIYYETTGISCVFLTQKEYYEFRVGKYNSYHCYAIKDKRVEAVPVDNIVTVWFRPNVTLEKYRCVLFESSSLRVVGVGYYPFKVNLKTEPMRPTNENKKKRK